MVSVIIPLFNVEQYILQCLESFENQAYKNFELIIVNDGSTDNSATIVENYIEKSEMKINLINQENAGVSAARNRGLDEATRECICFVDADDMVGPEFLSQMVETIKNDHCDLVICGSISVPDNWVMNEYYYRNHPVEIMNSYDALHKFLFHDIVSGVCFIMVKKDIIEKNNLRFANGYRYSEDLEMMWKIISHTSTVAYTRNQLYIYRLRNGSAMSLVDDKRIDGFKLMKGLEKYFEKARPDFSRIFRKYGTARWVWATMWQIAFASESYKSFSLNCKIYETKKHMKKLLTFPKLKVATTSFIYCISPTVYYYAIKYFGKKMYNARKLNA